jgi:hypothetical protein
VTNDSTTAYALEAPVGPATLRDWGGKSKVKTIPIAWVNVGKGYVSYLLMGLSADTKLIASLSPELRARMQGKSCFNFKAVDDRLFAELKSVTAESLLTMRTSGYIRDARIDRKPGSGGSREPA